MAALFYPFYCLVALLILAGSSAAQVAPPIIVFGDSTVDTGNNNYINTTHNFTANFPPHGKHYDDGKPNGRFCNGRMFIDYICEFIGIPHTVPYLQPEADYSKGVNFGSGGAGVLPATNAGLVIPLPQQLKYFAEFEEGIYEKWGSVQAKKYFSDAIYIVSIANNDYMAGYFGSPLVREEYTPQDFIALIVGEIIKACEFLYSKGARKFVVAEAGPIGCVPAVRQFHPNQECFEPGVQLGMAHNGALRMGLNGWQASHADVTISVAALYQFMMDRLSNPTAFGFKEGASACCGSGPLRGGGHCGKPNLHTGEEHTVCEDPEDYVFWDFYHGSERMHREFAKDLWEGKPEVIAPLSVRHLVDLSSAADCDAEQLGAYGGGAAAELLDSPVTHSSF